MIQTHKKGYKERLFNMTLHNVQVFWVGLTKPRFFSSDKTTVKQHSKTLRNKNVGYFSAFGCSVLVSGIWKNVVPALFQTLAINTPQPSSDKQPTFSWFSCAALVLFCSMKKGLTLKIRTFCNVMLNKPSFFFLFLFLLFSFYALGSFTEKKKKMKKEERKKKKEKRQRKKKTEKKDSFTNNFLAASSQ